MNSSEVESHCTVRKTIWVSSRWWPWPITNNKSTLWDIHDNGMVDYGFELPLTYLYCLNCRANGGYCYRRHAGGNDFACKPSSHIVSECDLGYPYSYYHLTFSCSDKLSIIALSLVLFLLTCNNFILFFFHVLTNKHCFARIM